MSTTEDQDATTTVGAALAEGLARAGVKIAFTVPGESVLGLIEGLAANRIRVVATRHEGSAAFMAGAVAQLTGRPAVCIGTRGPGAANLAIGLHAARADSAPVIAIVGQVRREIQGREAFQEMDLVRAFEPIVKWAAELKDAASASALIERAVVTATRGRPGPVLLSIPSDLMDAVVPAVGHGRTPPEHVAEPDPDLVRKILHLLADARRPLILAGAGVLRARSTDALVRFAETVRVPVVSSWRRGDLFPNDNPLYLGMTGLGAPASVLARLEEADALLVLGCRLGEITSYGYRIPGPGTTWAHVDADPWDGEGVHPGRVVSTLARVLPREAVITTDAGDFGTWAARGYRFHRPGTFLGSAAGPMGYGLPAAIGATLARPGRLGVVLAGDGGFAMTMADLETAVRERAHVVVVVFDNGRYGTIWRRQRERGDDAGIGTRLGPVDFAAVAEACGALGISVRTDAEFEPALRQALEAGRPALLHLALDARWSTPDAGLADVQPDATVEPETLPDAGLAETPASGEADVAPESPAAGEAEAAEPDRAPVIDPPADSERPAEADGQAGANGPAEAEGMAEPAPEPDAEEPDAAPAD